MKTIEFDEECKSCNGTGVFIGMAERDGAAVVCHTCKGTGCFHFIHTYEEFEKKKHNPEASRVYQYNPGIMIGNREGVCSLPDFGGMSYLDWRKGKRFPKGSEMRKFSCPCWWYQGADYEKKPNWKECLSNLGRTFSQCAHFPNKEMCWERWDKEFGK